MILTNSCKVHEKKVIETLGLVKGSTVRAKHIGKDIAASLKHLVGGELKGYTEMLEDARNVATEIMIKEAQGLGANAIVNIRFSTSSMMQGAAEILIYGTAVKVE